MQGGRPCANFSLWAPEQLPLAELRERITALPATLSIVVLDACQSGAFSRAKGAERASDFSFNSVDRLNTTRIAVIASSNERELSQESEELKSNYFTHSAHLEVPTTLEGTVLLQALPSWSVLAEPHEARCVVMASNWIEVRSRGGPRSCPIGICDVAPSP